MSSRERSYGVGYLDGVFDMFHVGQLDLLRRARTRCQTLVVGVLSDDFALAVTGRTPVVPADERADIVGALKIVDEVVLVRTTDIDAVWQQRPFDVVFKEASWRDTHRGQALVDLFAGRGVAVEFLPYEAEIASAVVRQFMSEKASDTL